MSQGLWKLAAETRTRGKATLRAARRWCLFVVYSFAYIALWGLRSFHPVGGQWGIREKLRVEKVEYFVTSFLNPLRLGAKASQWDEPCCKITGHPTMQRELLTLHYVYPLRKMHILCFELHSPHYFIFPFCLPICCAYLFCLPVCFLKCWVILKDVNFLLLLKNHNLSLSFVVWLGLTQRFQAVLTSWHIV